MTRQRYSIVESLNRIVRLFENKPVATDAPNTVTGDVLSESEAISDLAELFANSLPNETLTLPSAFYTAIQNSGFITGSSSTPVSTDGWIAATETWTYHAADDPSYVFSVNSNVTGSYAPGMRIKLNQTTDKYFIVTQVNITGSTTFVNVYGGTDYDLANAAITSPYYSHQKSPIGFNASPTLWTEQFISSNANVNRTPSPAATWYHLTGTLSIPIGVWDVSYFCPVYGTNATDNETIVLRTTLSTANNSESDFNWTSVAEITTPNSESFVFSAQLNRRGFITRESKATYYINHYSELEIDALYVINSASPTIIRATCAYL